MSLTIFPKVFSIDFTPQYNSTKPQPEKLSNPSQVASNGQVSEDHTELRTVKIISNDNDAFSEDTGPSGSEHKTRVRIDPETQKFVVEVVNDKTGQEVRQIPGEEQLKLNKGIGEYHSLAFDQNLNIKQNQSVQP
jgi:uncharacterized FlaG/YvyC family protein